MWDELVNLNIAVIALEQHSMECCCSCNLKTHPLPVQGHADFTGKHKLQVREQTLGYTKVIIALEHTADVSATSSA